MAFCTCRFSVNIEKIPERAIKILNNVFESKYESIKIYDVRTI